MMKKALSLVFACFIIAASLAACGSAQPKAASVSSSAPSESTPSTTTPSAPEAASPSASDQKAEAASELTKLLGNINQNVTVGTTGSHMTAVRTAVELLNWGVGTEMTTEEIRSAVIGWLMPKGNDEAVAFSEKLAAVDEAYKELLGDDAQDLLSSAGCVDAPYPWSDQPVESIETVMTAVGLR